MARNTLDKLDLRILSALANNARKAYLEIARRCGVSGAAIHQRMQKLQESGVVRGFETLINPSSLGYETCAYIGFFVNDNVSFAEVAAKLRSLPEVVECHGTTGKYDVLIKVYARNNNDLFDFIRNRLQPIGIGRSETIISFTEAFRRQIPIGCEAEFEEADNEENQSDSPDA